MSARLGVMTKPRSNASCLTISTLTNNGFCHLNYFIYFCISLITPHNPKHPMPIGNIVFNQGQGGLEPPLTGQDYVSGVLFYCTPVAEWLAGAPVYQSDQDYVTGDIVMAGDYIYQAIADTTGDFNPSDWTQLYAYAAYLTGNRVVYTDGYVYQCLATNSNSTFSTSFWRKLWPNQYPPTGWLQNNYVALSGEADAITNGILPARNDNNIYADSNFPDSLAATGSYTPASIGVVQDVTVITSSSLTTSGAVTVTLCTYTTGPDDVVGGLSALAASIAAAINSNTPDTGYSATVSGNTVTIIAPRSQGIWINTKGKLIITLNGTQQGSSHVTQFTGGIASQQAVWYYHISEFFRMQPKGLLYVGFNPVPGTYTFTEITEMQKFAGGTIRQVGIYLDGNSHPFTNTNLVADLGAIQSEIVNNNDNMHRPLSALYSANMYVPPPTGPMPLSSLMNLTALSSNKVSVVISQDGAGFGNFLFLTTGYTIGNIGLLLGSVAFGAVSDDLMWVAKFNVSNGVECDTPAFGTGVLVSAVSQNQLAALDTYRYIFLLKYTGNSGTFWNEGNTAISATSDYAYIEDNRTIDKACRGIYASLLPALGSPLDVNADGTLTNQTIAYFTSLSKVNLNQMVSNQELSAFAVSINPAQNVLSTSTLTITVQLVPVGVARTITFNIGYSVNVQT